MGEQHRLQLLMSPRSLRRIEDLMERTEAASMAAVVRRAVELYGACVDHVRAGGKVMLKNNDEVELVLIEAQPERDQS